jgi:hypothetical protein
MLPRASSLHNNSGALDSFVGAQEEQVPASEPYCSIITASWQSLFRPTARRANRNQPEGTGETETVPHRVCSGETGEQSILVQRALPVPTGHVASRPALPANARRRIGGGFS